MTFVPNPLFESELQREVSVRAGMLRIAEETAIVVEALAPDETGAYKATIEAGEDAESAYVTTTDFAGHIIEFGNATTPVYSPLRRGVRAAGLELHELPKP